MASGETLVWYGETVEGDDVNVTYTCVRRAGVFPFTQASDGAGSLDRLTHRKRPLQVQGLFTRGRGW